MASLSWPMQWFYLLFEVQGPSLGKPSCTHAQPPSCLVLPAAGLLHCALAGSGEVNLPFPLACCFSPHWGNILEILSTQKLLADIITGVGVGVCCLLFAVCCGSVASNHWEFSPCRDIWQSLQLFLVITPPGKRRYLVLEAMESTKHPTLQKITPPPNKELFDPRCQKCRWKKFSWSWYCLIPPIIYQNKFCSYSCNSSSYHKVALDLECLFVYWWIILNLD